MVVSDNSCYRNIDVSFPLERTTITSLYALIPCHLHFHESISPHKLQWSMTSLHLIGKTSHYIKYQTIIALLIYRLVNLLNHQWAAVVGIVMILDSLTTLTSFIVCESLEFCFQIFLIYAICYIIYAWLFPLKWLRCIFWPFGFKNHFTCLQQYKRRVNISQVRL